MNTHETIFDDNRIQLKYTTVHSHGALVPVHWHEHLEILQIMSGSMTAYVNEQTHELGVGDILIVTPLDIHSTRTHGECTYRMLQVPPVHLKRIREDPEALRFDGVLSPLPPNRDNSTFITHNMIFQELTQLLNTLNDLHERGEDGDQLLFLSKLYELLYVLYKKIAFVATPQSLGKNHRDFERVDQSMRYVQEHYTEEITLHDIAKLLSITEEHFCRIFKKSTGQTFLTYVSQIRLMHFYEKLMSTDATISQLLEENGIRNYKAFLKLFKKTYGESPQKLRQE